MTLKEFLFDSLESFENIYIDYGRYTKEMTSNLYDLLEGYEVEKWYLDIKNHAPCIIIKVADD